MRDDGFQLVKARVPAEHFEDPAVGGDEARRIAGAARDFAYRKIDAGHRRAMASTSRTLAPAHSRS